MQGDAKKVTVALDGVVVGTRRNTRAYTHAIVNTAAKYVVSYHLTESAATDNANRRRMRGATDLVVLPTVINLHPRYECLNKDLIPENYVVVTKDAYVAARCFFNDIARKKHGPDAKVRDIEYFALGGPRSMGSQYRAIIGTLHDDGVVYGKLFEITVQEVEIISDAAAA